jgi:hypothetical protein
MPCLHLLPNISPEPLSHNFQLLLVEFVKGLQHVFQRHLPFLVEIPALCSLGPHCSFHRLELPLEFRFGSQLFEVEDELDLLDFNGVLPVD